jgi:hypothetical protein
MNATLAKRNSDPTHGTAVLLEKLEDLRHFHNWHELN